MPEFIEREAFIKRLENEADKSSDVINLLILNGIANIVRDKNIAPTVDAVEVVRCKDCKHFSKVKQHRVTDLNFSYCHKFHHNITKDDDFCSYGERSPSE